MGIPTTFGTETAATGGQLDVNFAFVAALGAQPCTATGTNTIALAVAATGITPSAYQNYALFSFTAAATTTGVVTLSVGSLAALNVYLPSGVQVTTGNFVASDQIIVAYNSALNGSSGGFMVVAAPVIGTPSKFLDLIGSTQGDILYRDASAWAVLAPGTSGYVLATQGAAANPHWVSSSATGAGGYVSYMLTTAGAGSVNLATQFPTATATTKFRITIVGGGAGGGGVDTTNGAKAGGGASGQWAIAVFTGLAGLTLTTAVGAKGTGGANTGAAGNNGVATSVAYSSGGNTLAFSTQTASGGAGSTSATGAFAGGGAGNSAASVSVAGTIALVDTITANGQQGGTTGISGTGTTGVSGSGGSTPFGAGGAGLSGAGANNGHGYGAGGSGASDSAGAASAGGDATDGLILIEAWL